MLERKVFYPGLLVNNVRPENHGKIALEGEMSTFAGKSVLLKSILTLPEPSVRGGNSFYRAGAKRRIDRWPTKT